MDVQISDVVVLVQNNLIEVEVGPKSDQDLVCYVNSLILVGVVPNPTGLEDTIHKNVLFGVSCTLGYAL